MAQANGSIVLAKLISFLANERTVLAYLRTSLAFLATGVALQEFFDKPFLQTIGFVLIFMSAVVLIMGILSFVRVRKKISQQKESIPAKYWD